MTKSKAYNRRAEITKELQVLKEEITILSNKLRSLKVRHYTLHMELKTMELEELEESFAHSAVVS
jgi:hypothetical protein